MTRGELSAGLAGSFTAMAEAEMPGLRRFALGVCADPHRADDLVQGALERVYAVWPRVHDLERPGAYVRTVLVRLALREQRRHRWTRETSTPEPLDDRRTDPTDAAVERLDLTSLLRCLTVKQRAVVIMRFVEDLPLAEVADVLGVSHGTVKRQCHDALQRLRQQAHATAEPPLARRAR
ncbi:sigma-70 family RNA polymerase sigma factor [Aquipuribacter sp. MA13-6]|uniref:sigma-70 family RNA polymerase sigma factor n=1 Tax=unclassified Aquipuribacter TaxID=2635084 RepID=UPI003EEDDDAD